MNKKAQGLEIVFSLIVILLTTFGTISVIKEGSTIYVGDNRTNQFYDYSQCKTTIEQIPSENWMVFDSFENARDANYVPGEDCK